MVTINKQTNTQFTLLHTDGKTNARAGVLKTDHGEIETPIFMPVGKILIICICVPARKFWRRQADCTVLTGLTNRC